MKRKDTHVILIQTYVLDDKILTNITNGKKIEILDVH
jgi:hypothetical protein